MHPMAITLVLISAVMHALRNFFNKQAVDKQAFICCFESVGLILFTPVFIYACVTADGGPTIAIWYVVLSGVVHFCYWLLLAKTLEKGDLSLVYPIMRSSPALVLIISITILGEDVSALGITGILLVAFGVYTINMESLKFSDLLKPIKAIKTDRAIQFAFLTLLSVAAYTLVDKVAVGKMDPILFAYVYPWISLSLFAGYVAKVKPKGILKREWAARKRSIVACGFLSIFGYLLILLAFTFERMSYIVGLRQLSIVFAVLLGGHFLKEENRLIRIVSSIIIFTGAYLISFAG